MLFTFGCCGIVQLFDLFLLPGAVAEANSRLGLSSPPQSLPSPLPNVDSLRAEQNVASTRPRSNDDELDHLLRQAEESVNRTQKSDGDA